MTNEELGKIQRLMKKVFLISAGLYGLFVFCVIFLFKNILTDTQKVLIVIFAPMIVGFIILFIYKIKNPPVLDETCDDELDTELSETKESEE
ncbi:MAG: hypothetical protein PHE51_01655 [Eubacteriales bacterium]|nr:hypothetical protein [Eubacteriales bacterium]